MQDELRAYVASQQGVRQVRITSEQVTGLGGDPTDQTELITVQFAALDAGDATAAALGLLIVTESTLYCVDWGIADLEVVMIFTPYTLH